MQILPDEMDLLEDLSDPPPPTDSGIEVARSRSRGHYFPSFVFDSDTLRRLSRKALLNGDAINGCSALLWYLFPRDDVVLFTSYELRRMQDGTSDEHMWRITKKKAFWTRNLWIIPIHREHQVHWTLGVVDFNACSIEVFDSLADRIQSEEDIKVHQEDEVSAFLPSN